MSFDLRQNTPNPFNPSTTIAFSLPESAPVTLAIYDVNGRMVRTLVSGERAAGMHEVVWNGMDDNGRAVASGVYVYRLAAGNDVSIRRLALIR
jgi:flagellar hook assembly protein FlgD